MTTTPLDMRPMRIDADGHVVEDIAEISRRLPHWNGAAAPGLFGPFPHLDHLHHGVWVPPQGSFGNPGVHGWQSFMTELGLTAAVLYPTAGLSIGRLMDAAYAHGLCRAYNDWIHDAYLLRDSRFRAMGLIAMQDPDLAVEELRRCVEELGMAGAMLPANGLKMHLGSRAYFPVYAEADRLGCALAVHGGPHQGLGLDTFGVFAAVHALGHPIAVMEAMVAMLFHGVFDRFPRARYGFLEGGVAWMLLARERSHGSWKAFQPVDPRGEHARLRPGEGFAAYIQRHIDEGRIFVGVEGDEPDLPYAVQVLGNKPWIFSTDFPHEHGADKSQHELTELLDGDALSAADKIALVHDNAARFYGLSRAARPT
ncbi:amidohydrolase family protein [Chondromyces apiculatus]|uniref:2-amino-3-carboxymuconate-6-semialdehyde decarboxylase like protein n=1 Tax=Chondromyces apiculatus DSM 436 TaxID=1192034 RepID=A0A017T157_9BACT|nr:amidohydrolase family protein [Chondromyces apiculatus]EYF02989.1 2-amino-3-carboxymuconate-6-semialdehyde decarboxylase like protein [Chondromyces apiculatus DSM 436]